MKKKVVVPIAREQLREIASFNRSGNRAAAKRYVDTTRTLFLDLSDTYLPVRASEGLPESVRKIFVPGFGGYSLRVLYQGDFIALVAAFRPGLTDSMMDRHTRPGIAEFHRDTPT